MSGSIYYPKIQKEEEEKEEEQVPVYFSNMNELSKKRLALLGYSIFQKCSLGQPVSKDELENRIETIKGRYPSLTVKELIETCELSGSEEKERKTGENYKPYRVLKSGQETLHGIDVLSETTDIPEDVLSNILMDYDLNLHLKEVENDTDRFYTEKYTVLKENGKKYGVYKKYWKTNFTNLRARTGVIWVEANYWNDQLNGEYKEYDKDGNLIILTNYKDGKLDGEYKKFYYAKFDEEDNLHRFYEGKLDFQCFYKNDKLEGEYKSFHMNGQLSTQEYYKDGKEEGEHKEWYKNGQLRRKCYYKNGKIDGLEQEFYDNGNLKKQAFYKNNNLGVYQEFHKNLVLKLQAILTKTDDKTSDDETGNIKEFYDNGQLKLEKQLIEGKIKEKIKVFDSNGKLLGIQVYDDNELKITNPRIALNEKNCISPTYFWDDYENKCFEYLQEEKKMEKDCEEWIKNKTVNPVTGKKMIVGKKPYKEWEEKCK
jgi:antitoxin component YwqK of YwqJK toxin-antitoxin module